MAMPSNFIYSLVVLTPLFFGHFWDFSTHTHAHTHTFPSPAAMYVVRATGWISCAIPYGGLSCSIWSQPWMKEPVSHHRFVLLHLSRSAVAHFPPSLRPYCQPTDAMPFKLPLPVVHCLPRSCTSQQPPPPLPRLWGNISAFPQLSSSSSQCQHHCHLWTFYASSIG